MYTPQHIQYRRATWCNESDVQGQVYTYMCNAFHYISLYSVGFTEFKIPSSLFCICVAALLLVRCKSMTALLLLRCTLHALSKAQLPMTFSWFCISRTFYRVCIRMLSDLKAVCYYPAITYSLPPISSFKWPFD